MFFFHLSSIFPRFCPFFPWNMGNFSRAVPGALFFAQVPWASFGSSGSCASSRCQVSPGARCSPYCWIRSGRGRGAGPLNAVLSWNSGLTFVWFEELDSPCPKIANLEWKLVIVFQPLFGRVFINLGSAYSTNISPSEAEWCRFCRSEKLSGFRWQNGAWRTGRGSQLQARKPPHLNSGSWQMGRAYSHPWINDDKWW